jgi:hypothetical protein
MVAILFNVALIVAFPWWIFLAAALGWFEGLIAAAGVGVSARLVLRLFDAGMWTAWQIAVATFPGWLVSVVVVRFYGTSIGPPMISDLAGVLVVVLCAVATGVLVRYWNLRVSNR